MSSKSSYTKSVLNYGHIFQLLVGLYQPKVIVEFGILGGFSLSNFVMAGDSMKIKPSITAYDIFDKFNGNHANLEIHEIFKNNENVKILEGDFFETYRDIPDQSIDILHIDIANDGLIYKFAVENYMRKLSPKGIMILEGGSQERDEVEWMIKYNKPKIQDYLENNLKNGFNYIIMNKFPSVTIISKAEL